MGIKKMGNERLIPFPDEPLLMEKEVFSELKGLNRPKKPKETKLIFDGDKKTFSPIRFNPPDKMFHRYVSSGKCDGKYLIDSLNMVSEFTYDLGVLMNENLRPISIDTTKIDEVIKFCKYGMKKKSIDHELKYYYFNALRSMNMDDYENTVKYFDEYITNCLKNKKFVPLELYAIKAVLLERLNEYGRAISAYKKCLSLFSEPEDNLKSYLLFAMRKGLLEETLGAHKTAIETLKESLQYIENGPDHQFERRVIYTILGNCYGCLEDPRPGIELLEKLINLDNIKSLDDINYYLLRALMILIFLYHINKEYLRSMKLSKKFLKMSLIFNNWESDEHKKEFLNVLQKIYTKSKEEVITIQCGFRMLYSGETGLERNSSDRKKHNEEIMKRFRSTEFAEHLLERDPVSIYEGKIIFCSDKLYRVYEYDHSEFVVAESPEPDQATYITLKEDWFQTLSVDKQVIKRERSCDRYYHTTVDRWKEKLNKYF